MLRSNVKKGMVLLLQHRYPTEYVLSKEKSVYATGEKTELVFFYGIIITTIFCRGKL